MKSKHVDIEGVTFDLWNTLLVSEPGGIEVRQSAWQKVIDERGLNISPDLLLSTASFSPVTRHPLPSFSVIRFVMIKRTN